MSSAEFLNWCRIELLLARATEGLQKHFEESLQRKYGIAWDNTPESGRKFINRLGFNAYANSGKIQKKYLERGDIKKWDLTIFNSIFTMTDLNRNKEFQANLRRSIEVRNRMAHHPIKELSTRDFEYEWGELKDFVLFLGLTEEDLDDIKHCDRKDSKVHHLSENAKKAMELKLEGNKLQQENKFKLAAAKYTEAIILPGIPDVILSVLHANRSLCYLKLGDGKKALEDGKQSKRLNPGYVKAYFRIGKAHEWLNNYDKAIKNYDKALTFDANNDELIQLRSEARRLNGLKDRDNDESVNEAIRSKLSQKIENMGLKPSEEYKKMMIKKNPSLEHVWAGHEYRDNENYEMAAKCYNKAVDMRNPEAMYHLALLTAGGHGVPKDFSRALELLREAAKFDAFDKSRQPVVGVKEAEHSIGLSYEKGTLTEKNLPMAVRWYEKAISHGNDFSTNSLGLMYQNGNGVTKDLKRAEELFLFAIQHDDPNAMDNIVGLYMETGHIDKAKKWNEISKQNGSMAAFHREKSINEMLQHSSISDVVDWEKKNNLVSENMTVHERVLRKLERENPGESEKLLEMKKFLDEYQSVSNKTENMPLERINREYKYDLNVLEKRKDQSVYSNRLYLSVRHYERAVRIINGISPASSVGLNDESRSFITNLAMCYKLERYVVAIPMEKCEVIRKYVRQLLALSNTITKQSKSTNDKEFDQDCRLCYATLHSDAVFLTESIKKYPNNTHFLGLRGYLWVLEKNYESALRDFNCVEEILKDDVDNLYHKAETMRLMGGEWFEKAMQAYTKFLSVASEDHRKVPEAHYAMGLCALPSGSKEAVMRHFEDGLNAEKKQIPFFLPYESTSKQTLEMFQNIDQPNKAIKTKQPNEVVKMTDPLRKELIVGHRRAVNHYEQVRSKKYQVGVTMEPSKTQQAPMSWVGLKPIYLNEVDPTEDRVLEGYALELTLITAPYFNTMSTLFIAEDINKTVQRVSVFNFDKELAIGSKITVVNPYVRIATDGKPAIRVDDPGTIIVCPQQAVDICHYCGKANSKYSCAKCKQAKYCTKECQVLDWKELMHKLVCKQ